jgi:hypothetical protein
MNQKKIKILIGCLLFKDFTGSEMYVYELSKGLLTLGYDVSIISPNIGGELTNMAIKLGIKVYHTSEPPRYDFFNIIHTQHYVMTEFLVKIFPFLNKITTIHSEIISDENPYIHPTVYKYIAIRPEIKTHLIDNYNIPEDKIKVIYNPIDDKKFLPLNVENGNHTLFVGSLEHLRKKPLFDLVEYTKLNQKELWIVGNNHSNYLSELLLNEHVKYFPSTYNIDDFFHECSETAGILLGRTTIEGWMCGKPGWIYNVDSNGEILEKKFHEVPEDISKYYSSNVVYETHLMYQEIINNK